MTPEQFDKDFKEECDVVTDRLLKKRPDLSKEQMSLLVRALAKEFYVMAINEKQVNGQGTLMEDALSTGNE